MSTINRTILLEMFINHETLTIIDLCAENSSGLSPDRHHMQLLLEELEQDRYVKMLVGVLPPTYTITDRGLVEGIRLNNG